MNDSGRLSSEPMLSQNSTTLTIDLEQEEDGRWIAEVLELPGVLVYGMTQDEAITNVQALALRVIADKICFCVSG